MDNYCLYILALEDEKYYVGITRDVNKRYEEHVNGNGAQYTRINHPIGLVCMRQLNSWSLVQAEQEETRMTEVMMTLHGIENVRGGDYCQVSLDDLKRALGKETYSLLENEHRNLDKDQILSKYPEIKYGIELIKQDIKHPINIASYSTWPTRLYYEKAIEKKRILDEKLDKILKETMAIALDESRPLDERLEIFKSNLNKAFHEMGEFSVTLRSDEGPSVSFKIDKSLE